jgi:hypothetical protein
MCTTRLDGHWCVGAERQNQSSGKGLSFSIIQHVVRRSILGCDSISFRARAIPTADARPENFSLNFKAIALMRG